MLAQTPRWREGRVIVALGLALALAGCGGAKLGDLIKDKPAQEETP